MTSSGKSAPVEIKTSNLLIHSQNEISDPIYSLYRKTRKEVRGFRRTYLLYGDTGEHNKNVAKGAALACEITASEIEKQFSETTPSVHNAFLRYLRAAFNFGIRRVAAAKTRSMRIEVDAQRKLNQQNRKKRTSMKTACTSRIAFLNPRDLLGFALYATSLVLALTPMSSAGAGDNVAAELSQSVPAHAPGRWRATGHLVTARYTHTATLLSNGRVLVAGGYGSTPLTSVELYDPTTGTWTTTGSMDVAHFNHTATSLRNGFVLVAGGNNGETVTSAEVYHPAP